MKVYDASPEITSLDGIGFRVMFPNREYLDDQRFRPPKTPEQAKFNQKITKLLKQYDN